MQRKPENRFWHRFLHPNIPPDVEARRVETITPPGFPDVFWSGGSGLQRIGVIELKAEVGDVRPLQKNFLRKTARAGGLAHVLALKDGVVYLMNGYTGLTIDSKIIFGNAIGIWPLSQIDHDHLWFLVQNMSYNEE